MTAVNQESDPMQCHSKKEELWKDALVKEIGNDGATVQISGIDSSTHTVFARVVPSPDTEGDGAKVTIGEAVQIMVDEGWRHAAKEILEKHVHVENGEYPSAKELLKLGAVWIVNETAYTEGKNAHPRRLSEKDENTVPEWKDMSLRVHYHPDRFHVAHEYDWSKYCRGLVVGGNVGCGINGQTPHVPSSGLPDGKDGIIVYEDANLGFTVINKPGGMPDHASVSNHLEDVVTMFGKALKERKRLEVKKVYVSLPQKVECEKHGLMLISTCKDFTKYISAELEKQRNDHFAGDTGIKKKYRCLVAVKDPIKMDEIKKFQQQGTLITHYVDPNASFPKQFVRHKPTTADHDWLPCKMRITKVGDGKSPAAACVLSEVKDSKEFVLARALWGRNNKPAEHLHATYVMQLEVELLTNKIHQLRGQLAALGFPIVGDHLYGGGTCEYRSHHHVWNRMAIQICELSFVEPTREKKVEGGKESTILVPSGRKMDFTLSDAWWSKHLDQYNATGDVVGISQ